MSTADELFMLALMWAILSFLTGIYWGLIIKRRQYKPAILKIRAQIDDLLDQVDDLGRQVDDYMAFHHLVEQLYHYPECWDTMAYPTLYDAIFEMRGPCTTCEGESIEETRRRVMADFEAGVEVVVRCDHPEDAQVEVTHDPGNVDGIYCMACSARIGDLLEDEVEVVE